MNEAAANTLAAVGRWGVRLIIAGAALLVVDAAQDGARAAYGLLTCAYFLLTLGLGGWVFAALLAVTGARWADPWQRALGALAATLVVSGPLTVASVALLAPHYAWSPHAGDELGTFWFKAAWLSPGFFVGRAVAYVLLWLVLAAAICGLTPRRSPRPLASRRLRAALALVAFAPTFTLAACDWFMALEPMWFSTLWGGYHFAGLLLSTLAVVTLVCQGLRHTRWLGDFTDDHLHDLGKLTLGASCFWMYLWFSQYMLIWYAHIPEETSYYLARARGAWGTLTIANLALNWVVPFLWLLPRPRKRDGVGMMRLAGILLLGRWLDLHLMVAPSTAATWVWGPSEWGALALALGGLGTLLVWALRRRPTAAAPPLRSAPDPSSASGWPQSAP